MNGKISLDKKFFSEKKFRIFESEAFYAETWRYPSGIEALTMGNARGHLTILPFMGQMVWDAVFDGHDLTMKNMFRQPLPASTIVGTYGCYLYHSGLLRNGCPGKDDDHPLHGEMPCAPMDSATLVFGIDEAGEFLRLDGEYEYVMGFGNHYLAQPSIQLRADSGLFDASMAVTNLGGDNMELMYMCHMNQLFEKGAEIIQPMTYSPENVVTRTSVPDHVKPTSDWLEFLQLVAQSPDKMACLEEEEKYNPEFVFFLRNMKVDQVDNTHFLMKFVDGSGCYCRYSPLEFDHAVRWILSNADQKVAAFALPATCEPEGYLAEKEKGNVKTLTPGEKRTFNVRTGFLSPKECEQVANTIKSL